MATLEQLTSGAVNGDDEFTTDSVTVSTGDFLLVAISISPASTPVICEPAPVGLGVTTWERADDPGTQGQYEHLELWRGVVASGTTGTLVVDILDDSSNPVTADVCWHVLRVTDTVTTSNGADAFVQVVRAGSNSVTLADFDDPTNTALAVFFAGFFPEPDGTLDGDLTEVGTRAASNPGLYLELVAAEGPEETDDSYGITWVGQYIQRAIAAELVTSAPSGISGSSSTTQGDNTAAGTGTVAVVGVASQTQDGNTVSGAGAVAIVGSSSTAQGDSTVAAVATVAVSASLAVSQGDNTTAAAGTVAIVGASATTQGDSTVAATATVDSNDRFAESSTTQGDNAVSATGTVLVRGALATTQGDNTVSASDAPIDDLTPAVGTFGARSVAVGRFTTSPVAVGTFL